MRKAMPMHLHYEVRTVMLSKGSSAVTLEPVEWGRESDTETEVDPTDGVTYPKWEACQPTDDGAEAVGFGGKLTELRFDQEVDWRPGDYMSIKVGPSLTGEIAPTDLAA